MTTTNLCLRMKRDIRIALDRWARRLDATEMTIHKDGSVDLFCGGDCICLNYTPSAKELYK